MQSIRQVHLVRMTVQYPQGSPSIGRTTARAQRNPGNCQTQLRQVLREGASNWATGEAADPGSVAAIATMMTTLLEGRMRQYVRSRFESKPLAG